MDTFPNLIITSLADLALVFFFHPLVWESNQWTRHLIIKSIVEHVLLRHLSLPKDDVLQFVDQLDFSLVCGTEGIH